LKSLEKVKQKFGSWFWIRVLNYKNCFCLQNKLFYCNANTVMCESVIKNVGFIICLINWPFKIRSNIKEWLEWAKIRLDWVAIVKNVFSKNKSFGFGHPVGQYQQVHCCNMRVYSTIDRVMYTWGKLWIGHHSRSSDCRGSLQASGTENPRNVSRRYVAWTNWFLSGWLSKSNWNQLSNKFLPWASCVSISNMKTLDFLIVHIFLVQQDVPRI